MLKAKQLNMFMPQDRDISEPMAKGVRQKLEKSAKKIPSVTIGNLTLTKHNSKLGNRSFTEQKTPKFFSIVRCAWIGV